MIPGLQPIPLTELKVLSSPKVWQIKGGLDSFSCFTPVTGKVIAEHQGGILLLKGTLSTIIFLECDRCLKEYKQKLECNCEELILIKDSSISPSNEVKNRIPPEDFMDSLTPQESFDPERWIFEQLSLQIPLLKVCSETCKIPASLVSNTNSKYSQSSSDLNVSYDPRWAQLKKLL